MAGDISEHLGAKNLCLGLEHILQDVRHIVEMAVDRRLGHRSLARQKVRRDFFKAIDEEQGARCRQYSRF
jgi:hypothetical protein